ncbi:hypothetical protein JUJ52_10370 [Virgibacillus sp. AGTR]|uniref:hypothetical protein n=1 Tax=Virgibacillus sp. AGTR TaxID=2812055 RepID=UPI001D1693A6|nr:hypothetical protein [Virgibacillus sp. AGTR]MCC2250369.1 hypothetical protein [Virgibacillus sp. AGTR]
MRLTQPLQPAANITWISGEPEQLELVFGTPEEQAEIERLAEQERELIRDYLYQYVHPAQLPEWIEAIILDHDFELHQLDKMREEVSANAK